MCGNDPDDGKQEKDKRERKENRLKEASENLGKRNSVRDQQIPLEEYRR